MRDLAILLAAVLFLFRDAVFGGRVLYERDIHLNRYEQMQSFVEALASGAWPLWDRFAGFGQPMLANPEFQICYPSTWLNLLLMPGTSYTVFVVGHLLLTSLGCQRLALALGLSRPASLTAAALWLLSGPLLSLVNAYHHFAGASWLPWVALAAISSTRSPSLARGLWLGAALAAQLLAGSADMSLLSGLIVALIHLGRLRWSEPLAIRNRRLAGSALLAIVVALGLSAVQLLPTLAVASRSSRTQLPEQARTYFSVHPLRTLETLVPVRLYDLPLDPELRTTLFERARQPFLESLYLGLPALALVCAAWWTTRRRLLALLALVGLGSLLLGLGRHFVAYDLAVGLLPPLKMLRYPEKALIATAFAWALLAGLGLDVWRLATPRRRFGLGVGLPLLLSSLLATGALLLSRRPGLAGPGVWHPEAVVLDHVSRWQLGLAAALGLSITALLFSLWRAGGHRRALLLGHALAFLAVGDLALRHQQLNPTAFAELLSYRPAFVEDLRGSGRLHVVDYDVQGKSQRLLGRESAYELERFLPGWPHAVADALARRMSLIPPIAGGWGIEGSFEGDARGLYPPYQVQLVQAARDLEGTILQRRLLDLGAVSHVVTLHERGFENLERVASFQGLARDPVLVYRVPEPLPRSLVVSGIRVAGDDDAFRVLLSAGFDPRRELLLPEGVERPADPGFQGESRILELRADRVRLAVELNRAGHVVLVDAFDPGWRGSVDGQPVSVERANLAFRAVPVPAGRHTVELEYRPASAYWGLATSLSFILAVLGLALARRRRTGA